MDESRILQPPKDLRYLKRLKETQLIFDMMAFEPTVVISSIEMYMLEIGGETASWGVHCRFNDEV